jgi:putative acyl-CoA dehydrogenase
MTSTYLPDELPGRFLAETHTVSNVSQELRDYNMYIEDLALVAGVRREGREAAEQGLAAFGQLTGSGDYLELGALANQFRPELHTHDRFGRRIDEVKFHPAYHQLMKSAIEHGLHASPWTAPGPGAHVARAARTYLQTQVEAGHGCPITMTFAALPSLRLQPELARLWESRITAPIYDPRNVPAEHKAGVTVGMAMTEKQGGSDVRANTTRAYPIGTGGGGQAYELVGHKYFVSAPMCDLFLVLAQAPGGLSCFLLPRWRPDGSRNALQILRLKNKMGNVSNASSETELRGALAWMVGEEGRGVRTIIEMVSMTRFDCMVGSSAGMRMALSQALHHCRLRSAFGRRLNEQPLMQNVLADMALESEAALTLTLRMARAMDERANEQEDLLVRLVTAVGKYWICKRTPALAYEAMECIGGSGVMEDSMMPRLYREAPVNAIWEGSGNVQCLDVLRACERTPRVLEALFSELELARHQHPALDRSIDELHRALAAADPLEYRARRVVEQMATTLQASLLLRHAPAEIAGAFCASRLGGQSHQLFGTLPDGVDAGAIIARATPHGKA